MNERGERAAGSGSALHDRGSGASAVAVHGRLATPLGDVEVTLVGARVHTLRFVSTAEPTPGERKPAAVVVRWPGAGAGARPMDELAATLGRYFAGHLEALDEIECEPAGTPFQRRVWATLRGVGAGSTTSYAALARALHPPSVARAVGAANGANPVALVIPCHRVIGADGALTGYAGGLWRKRWLLRHEGALAEQRPLFGPALERP